MQRAAKKPPLHKHVEVRREAEATVLRMKHAYANSAQNHIPAFQADTAVTQHSQHWGEDELLAPVTPSSSCPEAQDTTGYTGTRVVRMNPSAWEHHTPMAVCHMQHLHPSLLLTVHLHLVLPLYIDSAKCFLISS